MRLVGALYVIMTLDSDEVCLSLKKKQYILNTDQGVNKSNCYEL